MTKVLSKNMLGVLVLAGLAVLLLARPVYAEEADMGERVATLGSANEVMAVTAAEAPTALSVSNEEAVNIRPISQEELALLKSALDVLGDLLVVMEKMVAAMPQGEETIARATEMNAVLEGISLQLVDLNTTLAGTVVSGSNLAKEATTPSESKAIGEVAGLSRTDVGSAVQKGSVETVTADTVQEESKSSLTAILNSPQAVIIALVFALIFSVILFMRRSRNEEAQLA